MAKVSVIIPTYNRSNLVREAVQSVLRQSFADFEVLVVDDGSTDDTRSIIECILDNRIRYFYKDNGGQSSARNFGLAKATGEYIAYLDEDDLWPVDYLKIMIEHLNTHQEYGAAYTRVIEQFPDGRKEEMSSPERYKSGWITKYSFDLGPCLMPSATCFRKSVWKDFFWDEAIRRCPDYDVFLRISTRAQFLFVPDTYVIKRWYSENLSSVKDPVGMIDKAHTLERFYFHLGGNKYVMRKAANRKISRAYRKAGKISLAMGDRHSAMSLFKKASSYYPLDTRLYFDFLKALLKSKKGKIVMNWLMPKPLPPYITVTQKPRKMSDSLD